MSNDLLVVGCGHLGSIIAQRWKAEHPDASVVGITASTERHDALREQGIQPVLRSDFQGDVFARVVYCVTPSKVADYAQDIAGVMPWVSPMGKIVFTSSTGVYAGDKGEDITEDSPLSDSARAQRLRDGEDVVLKHDGGHVVRLAGLYDFSRGPHRVFLRMPSIDKRPDGWLNLIHYKDAADLVRCVLVADDAPKISLGCDNAPITRQALTVAAAKARRFYETGSGGDPCGCQFTATDGPLGKRATNHNTRRALSWSPRFDSFAAYVASFDD